ncbi:MAG: response regulator transcription factor [Labilithrix sp.]|nr:response regulator transcription factor [Labilithrix sp.]MCW5817330.1 response regulator transcription factor [Labilithrix sp.]
MRGRVDANGLSHQLQICVHLCIRQAGTCEIGARYVEARMSPRASGHQDDSMRGASDERPPELVELLVTSLDELARLTCRDPRVEGWIAAQRRRLDSLRLAIRAARESAGEEERLGGIERDIALADVDRLAPTAAREWSLTDRQSQVLRLVAEGLSNKEIGTVARMSPRTVEVHVTAILQKSGVDTRTRLIAETWRRRRRWARASESPAEPEDVG